MAATRRNGTPACSFTKAAGYADASEMDKYRLVENIGKGSFGVISKVQRIEDGREFALKQLDYGKMTERDRRQIAAEVAILESLRHRNIVQLVQKIADQRNERIYIVMEYCTSGDLGSLIRRTQRNNAIVHEEKIWNVFLQITLALDHCHWPADRRKPGSRVGTVADGNTHTQVLHRDLKPENVFLSGEFIKLGDFGLSKDMAGSAFTSTYVGTPLYMPPEILAENRYDTKSDIWSLGCLVFEMCALTSPFATAQTQEELIQMVRSGKLPPLPSRISPSLKTAIRAMLNLNPVRRPSTKDLLEMDEMKLHLRLFKLQNQTVTFNRAKEELQHREALVQEKAAALKQLNTELAAKEAALAERERISRERELAVDTREQNVLERENVVRENHLRVNQGMEMLRQGWANIREEKERLQATSTVTSTQVVAAQVTSTQTTDVEVVRAPAPEPPMTRPPLEERKTVPVSSRFTRHPSYEDTPSKIPFPSAFASPTPLDSRLNSKLSVLAKRRGSNASSSLPRRLASKSLTNLVARARADAEEEFLMPLQSTPARKGPPGTPNRHIAGRTSIGSPGELERVFAEDITMATASFAGSPSILPSPFHARPRKSFSEDGLELIAHLPPTLIPAPTFIYRPEGTPAKWSAEDPDCPSPFIRRSGGAPLLPGLTIPPHTLAPAIKSATERERPPLSSINSQPAVSALEPKSGGSGSRKIPRSRSGSLHRGVLRHNAVRSTGDASALATSPTSATTPRDFMPSKEVSATPAGPPGSTGLAAGLASLGTLGGLTGGAVRSRVLVGRDPARC